MCAVGWEQRLRGSASPPASPSDERNPGQGAQIPNLGSRGATSLPHPLPWQITGRPDCCPGWPAEGTELPVFRSGGPDPREKGWDPGVRE